MSSTAAATAALAVTAAGVASTNINGFAILGNREVTLPSYSIGWEVVVYLL
jgi:hypothetical protein